MPHGIKLSWETERAQWLGGFGQTPDHAHQVLGLQEDQSERAQIGADRNQLVFIMKNLLLI